MIMQNLRKRRGIVRLEAARCPDNDDNNQKDEGRSKKLINFRTYPPYLGLIPKIYHFFTPSLYHQHLRGASSASKFPLVTHVDK